MTAAIPPARARAIAIWLFAVVVMVFVMVIIGGLTRLTHSGLSIVEWKPLTGWWPPTTEADWQALFDAYRQYPEFRKVNPGMDVEGFKGIFWLEFIHRVWGRLIGIVFFVPFVFFAVRGWLTRGLTVRLAGLFVLGGLQGAMGWYMVTSGMVDHPDVSQYRLTAHFGLALVIIAFALWLAFALLHPGRWGAGAGVPVRFARGATALAVLVFVTALSGGFVAGLDAGFAFATFPDMDGEMIPAGLYDDGWRSAFEDITTVQFNHRILAESTLVLVLVFWWRARGLRLGIGPRRAVSLLALAGVAQVGLGISTLLLGVPLVLASLHQGGAVVLFSAVLWAAFMLNRREL